MPYNSPALKSCHCRHGACDSISWGELGGLQRAMLSGCGVAAGWGSGLGHRVGVRAGTPGGGQGWDRGSQSWGQWVGVGADDMG